jgi:hypothetical protein
MQTEVFVRASRISGVAQIMCVRLSRLPSVSAPMRLILPLNTSKIVLVSQQNPTLFAPLQIHHLEPPCTFKVRSGCAR